jgi:hypothetical protein
MGTFLLKTSQSKSFYARVMSSQSCEIQNLKKSKKFKTFTNLIQALPHKTSRGKGDNNHF